MSSVELPVFGSDAGVASHQYARFPQEHQENAHKQAVLRTHIGEDAFAYAWNLGQALTLGQAIAFAVAEEQPAGT